MKDLKKIFLIIAVVVASMPMLRAQVETPVEWTKAVKMIGEREGVVTLSATIAHGWHVYSTQVPQGGPKPLMVEWRNLDGVELVGELTPAVAPIETHDDVFQMNLSFWTDEVTLTQKIRATASEFKIDGVVRYMVCNDRQCLSPTEEIDLAGKAKITNETPAQVDNNLNALSDSVISNTSDTAADLWAPVTITDAAGDVSASHSSLWWIFLACFLGGLVALLTPCVWPIIPLTVSFFLKKSGDKRKAVSQALTYGVSIVVIYLILGLIVTAIFGADALNNLATNAVCNIVFFALLVLFAMSFFGAFDITLPQSWSNRMDARAERTTGIVSIFFMAFTLVIVSFSCTGPIIGTLLVEAASSGGTLAPAVGMLGFAIALAVPFTLFAMFPSWLKQLPRSGGWLNTVKVTLGFVELALSLKFFSVADLAYGWHLLDREVFIALWIAIFGTMGLYLLGVFKFKSDADESKIGVTRFMLALASFAFATYLVPGLWGAPLRATSAFVPPLYTQDFNLYGDDTSRYDDYDEGMLAATRERKPVFVDFNGFGCVNCRKMDGAVLSRDEVKRKIATEFVTIELMVDDRTPLNKPILVNENGKVVKLTTVGDKWSYLQRHKFGANSQPYYVILNNNGELMSGPVAYDENVDRFIEFLDKGLQNYSK